MPAPYFKKISTLTLLCLIRLRNTLSKTDIDRKMKEGIKMEENYTRRVVQCLQFQVWLQIGKIGKGIPGNSSVVFPLNKSILNMIWFSFQQIRSNSNQRQHCKSCSRRSIVHQDESIALISNKGFLVVILTGCRQLLQVLSVTRNKPSVSRENNLNSCAAKHVVSVRVSSFRYTMRQ